MEIRQLVFRVKVLPLVLETLYFKQDGTQYIKVVTK